MIDYRIYTFLMLCERMNYRKTAEELHMTQPAVTQHIHYLEEEYGCKLFSYNGKILRMTEEGIALERYARSMLFNEKKFKEKLGKSYKIPIRIGATKTIGDYTMEEKILELLGRNDLQLKVVIDNTENLLANLNTFQLDLLLIEGFVDKNSYGHQLIKKEELIGVCSKTHPFAYKEVALDNIFKEKILLREKGSGTRAVFEIFLNEKGYSEESFKDYSVISSFPLIAKAVSKNFGISFVYESIVKKHEELAFFRIIGEEIFHEFNYVFLKNVDVDAYLELLK